MGVRAVRTLRLEGDLAMSKVVGAIIAVVVLGVGIFLFTSMKSPNSASDQKLLLAAQNNDLAGVQEALGEGANVNAKMESSKLNQMMGKIDQAYEGYTALHFAVQKHNLDMVKLLVEKKAEINVQDYHKNTPLMVGAAFLNREAVVFLLEKKADPNIRNDRGDTAINLSRKRMGGAKEGQEIEQLLKDAGGQPGVGSGDGPPPPAGGGG